MGKKRYYVVWKGLVPGVYDTWDECQAQINGVKQALYKSFASLAEAERAYSEHEDPIRVRFKEQSAEDLL